MQRRTTESGITHKGEEQLMEKGLQDRTLEKEEELSTRERIVAQCRTGRTQNKSSSLVKKELLQGVGDVVKHRKESCSLGGKNFSTG